MQARAAKISFWRVVLAVLLPAICAGAAKNSSPAQVTLIATMPATFSLQAGSATVTGASGTVQVRSTGRGTALISGQVRGQGGTAMVRVPISLAANTRTFVVQANMQHGSARGTIFLNSPGLMARRMPLRGQAFLAMATARNDGREFFLLDRPLQSTMEIVFPNLPSGETSSFRIVVNMRDLGY